MKLMNHPNVIKIHDVFQSKSSLLCIVMEYAQLGDLDAIIEERSLQL